MTTRHLTKSNHIHYYHSSPLKIGEIKQLDVKQLEIYATPRTRSIIRKAGKVGDLISLWDQKGKSKLHFKKEISPKNHTNSTKKRRLSNISNNFFLVIDRSRKYDQNKQGGSLTMRSNRRTGKSRFTFAKTRIPKTNKANSMKQRRSTEKETHSPLRTNSPIIEPI